MDLVLVPGGDAMLVGETLTTPRDTVVAAISSAGQGANTFYGTGYTTFNQGYTDGGSYITLDLTTSFATETSLVIAGAVDLGNGAGEDFSLLRYSRLASLPITIANASLVVTAGTISSYEGTAVNYSASFTDPGAQARTATINWGDGSGNQTATVHQTSNTVSGSHTYADNGNYTITVIVNDGIAGGSATTSATIGNVAPTVSISGAPSTSPEGTAITLTSTVTDPGSADTTFTRAWTVLRDGNAFATGTGTSINFTPLQNGTYAASLAATDKDSGTGSANASITVTDVAPTLELTGDPTAIFETNYELTLGSVVDPGQDTVSEYVINWGNGQSTTISAANLPTSRIVTHQFAESLVGEDCDIYVSIVDGDGTHAAAGTKTITVILPPSLSAADLEGEEGEEIQLTADYVDMGPTVSHTATINWGDGTTTDGELDESYGFGTVTGTHAYVDNGDYVITVTVSRPGLNLPQTLSAMISNVAPDGEIFVLPPVTGETAATVKIGEIKEPSTVDAADLRFSFDFNNNGSFEDEGDVYNSTSSGTAHTLVLPGMYIIRGVIKDKDGASTKLSKSIVVTSNAGSLEISDGPDMALVSPVQVAAPGGNQSADEGEDHEFELGSFTDPTDGGGPYSVEVDWGDGAENTTFSVDDPGNLDPQSHKYDDNGEYEVNVRVTNALGAHETSTFTVTIDNVDPDVSDSEFEVTPQPGDPQNITEGLPVTITVSGVTDESETDEDAGFEYRFKAGNGEWGAYQTSPTFNFKPEDDADVEVYWRVRDKDGGWSEHHQISDYPSTFIRCAEYFRKCRLRCGQAQ